MGNEIAGQFKASYLANKRMEEARTAEEKAEDEQVANSGDFVGYDDSKNAIYNKGGALTSLNATDFSRTLNKLKADPNNAAKSYNDYAGNEQLKALGGEYQGRDEETGAAVFKKGDETFGIEKDDAEYKNMLSVAQKADPNKTWFNPEYEKQFNEAQNSGNKFSGMDASGNMISQNNLGQYETVENKDGGFYKFAKRNMGDQKFAGVQGLSNATAGENVTPMGASQARVGSDSDRSRRTLDDNKGGFSRFSASASPAQSQQTPAPVASFNPPTSGQDNNTQFNATQNQSARVRPPIQFQKPQEPQDTQEPQMGIKDAALQMGKQYATDFASNKLAEAKTTAKTAVTDMAKEQTQPYKDQANTALTNATGIDVTKSTGLGDVSGAVKDPGAFLKQRAENQANAVAKPYKDQATASLTNAIGISNLGDVSNMVKDPGGYLKQQAADKAKSYVSDKLGFDVGAAVNDPMKFAVQQGKEQGLNALSNSAGFDVGKAASLFKGNVTDNVKELAKEQAEKEAKRQALNQIASSTGVDVNAVKGGLQVGKDILKGGINENTARMAAETAARAMIASYTGRLVTPENLHLAGGLADAGYDKSKKMLGNTAGGVLGSGLQAGGAALNAGGDILGAGIGAVGDLGANAYNNVKDVGKGLNMLGKGNIGSGLKTIGKSFANTAYSSAVKAPVALAKKSVKAIGSAIKSIFCFDQDTEILMENGSYKKIKDIKLGDKVELGGLVTAIGQSASNEIYDYNGVKVSAGHAVFEDGKWVRISDSKYAVELKGDARIVFPMSTEHHLIVTKGQVWADNLEVDDTYDFKDSEILEQLNKKTVRNKMLKTYVKVKFGDS